MAQAMIDTQFQYWVWITFAAIVAGYAADIRLTRRLRFFASGLYLFACTALVFRFYYAGQGAMAIREVLVESGASFFPDAGFVIIPRGITFFVGTAAAVYLLLGKHKAANPASV